MRPKKQATKLDFNRQEIIEKNREDRDWFIKKWAEYVRTHPDEEWSRQQAVLIDSVFRKRTGALSGSDSSTKSACQK